MIGDERHSLRDGAKLQRALAVNTKARTHAWNRFLFFVFVFVFIFCSVWNTKRVLMPPDTKELFFPNTKGFKYFEPLNRNGAKVRCSSLCCVDATGCHAYRYIRLAREADSY